MIPEIIQRKIQEVLGSKYNEFRIFSSSPLSGGDINQAAKLETSTGDFFIKWNRSDLYPEMFAKEAQGLHLLSESNVIRIPEVITYADVEQHSFLLLEFVQSISRENNFWFDFGKKLARLHKNSSDYFGLDHDNFIGSLPQINSQKNSWIDFFIENRINFQLKLARDSGLIDRGLIAASERMFAVLNEIIPIEPSSLLHGDLWSGNLIVGGSGSACLIDPAVYYGHREVDIAMTRLFGGFSDDFYTAYQQEYPMEKDWHKRMDIFNLYPLLVHVNLFGGSYVNQVASILNRF